VLVDELEKAILRFLESRPPDWKWGTSSKVYSRDETIERFKKDKRFRKLIIERAHILAIELFSRESEKGKVE
jgi:hypothetical protein